ncbi:hypothetical protein SAMN06265222_1414 [Neorhodopirellula lusitana]|uniref:Uncharacterized protein n=1 Tax=Neorhodopirellula lusitana TaxID=445327 RepID=A0ABY1QT21_9BACT|nr:hypothetical protein SAMN06265222_1414 [Neorhodopirellula lusitana]
MLIVALSFGLISNWTVSRREINAYKASEEARERLEDTLELELVRALQPGTNLDDVPLYRLLVDRVVTDDDTTFLGYSQYLSKYVDGVPSSFAGCELHEFSCFHEDGATEILYTVVVCSNRCVLVTQTMVTLHPMN